MTDRSQATVMECMETSQKSPAFRVCVAAYLLRLTDAHAWLRQQVDTTDRLLLSRWIVDHASAREK
jgi:hypothetical protein